MFSPLLPSALDGRTQAFPVLSVSQIDRIRSVASRGRSPETKYSSNLAMRTFLSEEQPAENDQSGPGQRHPARLARIRTNPLSRSSSRLHSRPSLCRFHCFVCDRFGIVPAAVTSDDMVGFRRAPGVWLVLANRRRVSQDRIDNCPSSFHSVLADE